MRLSVQPLIAAPRIQRRIAELGAQIRGDYAGRDLVLVVLLKGAVIFAADLMRRLDNNVSVDFLRAASYDGMRSTGEVTVRTIPETPLSGRHVLLVEDILDTGRTLAAAQQWVRTQKPASLASIALLDKPARREVEARAEYTGFTIDDHFVVGYGLDYNQHYRQLDSIYVLEAE